MSIRIILADDHKIVRDGLRALIDKQQGMEVVAEGENGRMTVSLVRELSPDVVIMDIGMPDLNGIEATRQIIAEGAAVKVIALSMHSDRRFVAEMFKAGASAYLLKDSAFEELAQAVRVVLAGRVYLSPEITGTVMEDYLHRLSDTGSSGFSVLTAREREVLQLLAEGVTTKQIAVRLHVSVKTIETYRKQIMDKLNLRSVADLTKYAVREGMTTLEP